MDLLNQYFDIKEQVYSYFGYKEDWVSIPLEDARAYYWTLHEEEDGSGTVGFADTEQELETQNGNYYESDIYTQRFLPKWVYRGEDYTMIATNPHVDGNRFLSIFDNSKERNY